MNIARTHKRTYQPLAQNDFDDAQYQVSGGSSDSEPEGDDPEAALTTGRRWLRSTNGTIVDIDPLQAGKQTDMYKCSNRNGTCDRQFTLLQQCSNETLPISAWCSLRAVRFRVAKVRA
uniref:Uncharacterized protein n=1 Tax=Anopheles culicifacies TaxID=139723 RepID=A0A182MDN6_9DIPT